MRGSPVAVIAVGAAVAGRRHRPHRTPAQAHGDSRTSRSAISPSGASTAATFQVSNLQTVRRGRPVDPHQLRVRQRQRGRRLRLGRHRGRDWADCQFPAAQSVDGVADVAGQPLAGNLNQLAELKAEEPAACRC